MNTSKRFTNLLMITMMVISIVITSAVTAPVDAATPKAPVQVKGVKAVAASTSEIKLSWTKVAKNKNTKGYAIYRQGKLIKRVSYKTNSFSDTGLASGAKYTYTVRAYNSYKQKQYYNSKTKKWQKKKPAKKNWKGKKTRKVKAYKYGKASAAVAVATKKTASVKVSPTITANGDATIEVSEIYDLDVSSDSPGAITYSSSDPTIATVSSSGVVTGKKTGTVIITIKQAAHGNYLAGSTTTQVTVVKAKDTKFMNCNLPGTMTHNLSEGKFTINVESTNGARYESSNPLIATVSNGISANLPSGYTTVTLYKAGTVNITITSKFNSDQRHTIKLIVLDDLNVATVPNIEVSPIEIEVGESRNLTVNSNSTGTITYKSSNSNIATVSSSGVVTGQGAGTATITISQAATNDYLAGSTTTKVTVNEPVVPVVEYDDFAVVGTIPTVVNIGTSSLDYNVVLPTNNCTVTWKSSKPKSIDVTQTSAKSFMLTVYKPSASRRDVVAKNIIITGTLNNYPSDYKGPTELRYTIENTGYPIEGTTSTGNIYKVVRRYGNIYVGGYIDNNFTFTYMPSGSTFKINASEFAGYKF